ncbi:MAG: hypothetical protein DRJ46_04060 [Thermoprotei archaeon]|nr:MAG: hypothetical protein DRJ46_04060 [Thermoprotei archaeon]
MPRPARSLNGQAKEFRARVSAVKAEMEACYYDWGVNRSSSSLSISKEEFQCWHARRTGRLPGNFNCLEYDHRKVRGYWPDINKEEVRQLYLHKAMKLIDCGVDAIWIDRLLKQARLIYSITGNIKHPAIEETLPKIKDYMGEDIVILVRPNLGSPYSPIHVFSQYLNSSQRRKFLAYLGNFLGEVEFYSPIRPSGLTWVHGRKNEAKILSWREVYWVNVFGEGRCGFPVYDSLAPEFQTYETIRELAQSRRGERRE